MGLFPYNRNLKPLLLVWKNWLYAQEQERKRNIENVLSGNLQVVLHSSPITNGNVCSGFERSIKRWQARGKEFVKP